MFGKHIVVGGGTGYIGSAIAHALKAAGAAVTIVSRQPRAPNMMTWISQTGLPKDATGVINVAGVNILDPIHRWTQDFKDEVWKSRVDTNKTLANAIRHSNVECFATISGVAYYKPNGREYTEYDSCEQYDYLSELCHAWEGAAKLPEDSKCRRVTIRSGVVLGRTGGMIAQSFWPFFLGVGGPMGRGDQFMPWIHIADLVDLFELALENKDVNGILNGVAPQVITNKEFTMAFAKALRRPAFFPLPAFLLKIVFGEERAKIILEGQKVIPKRVQEYGFQYNYPTIEEACKQFGVLVYTHAPY